jgi:hypothetical protein
MWSPNTHETTNEQTCRHTLVLHGDGTHECDGAGSCGADELAHEWWVACDELGCGCVGAERDLVLARAA